MDTGNEGVDRVLHAVVPELPPEPKKAPPPEAHSTVKNTDPSVLTGPAAREVVRKQQSEARRFSMIVPAFPIPEQVAGSSHEFEIPLPLNLDPSGKPVEIALSMDGEDMAVAVAGPTAQSVAGPMPTKADLPVGRIRFSPKRIGDYRGTLGVVGNWPDGHSETVDVAIVASARWIDQAPRQQPKAETPTSNPEVVPTTATDDPSVDTLPKLRTIGERVDHRIDEIIDFQHDGVSMVEKEAGKYVPPAPPESAWAMLVELAMTLGTAGVAAVAGALVGKAIAAAAHRLVPHSAHELVADGLGTMVEDGMKDSVGKAIHQKEGAESAPPGEKKDTKAPKSKPLSADSQIALFARMFHVLGSLRGLHKDKAGEMRDTLEKRHGADSIVARQGLMAVADGLDQIQMTATEKQAAATAPQWVSYVARAEHGTEEVDAPGGPIAVTKMNVLRGDGEKNRPPQSKGVLNLAIRGLDVETTSPYAPSVTGVGRALAARLLSADLNQTPIPIRFLFGYTTITRDEAGRVRISQWQDPKSGLNEVQRVAMAEQVVAKILSKPLEAWGLSEIQTDDTAKEG